MPLTHNWTLRRDQTASVISRDLWTVVFTGRGDTPEDDIRTVEIACTIKPSGTRGGVRSTPIQLPGEAEVAHYTHVALMAWDSDPLPRRGDTCKATQDSTGIEHEYRVVFVDRYAYKIEILLDEVQ